MAPPRPFGPCRGFVNLPASPRLTPWAIFFRSYELWFGAFLGSPLFCRPPMRFWSRRCALALTIAAFACLGPGAAGQQTAAKTPAFAVLDPADAAQWQTWAKESGWQVSAPAAGLAADATIDTRAQALAAAVQDAVRNAGVDAARVYLAGRGAACAAVF